MRRRHAIILVTIGVLAALWLPQTTRGQDCDRPGCRADSTSPHRTFPAESLGESLPKGVINTLWIDADRVVWAGSDEGFGRYDGRAWTWFDPADTLGRNVRALIGDDAGGVWIGAQDGLGHFDGVSPQTITRIDGLNEPWVNSLASDGEGGLWIGLLRGLAHFDGAQVDMQIDQLDGESLGAVKVVLASGNGNAIFAVEIGLESEIVEVTRAGGARRLRREAGSSVRTLQALAADDAGRLYAGSSLGLHRMTEAGLQRIDLPGGPTDILSLTSDGADGLWIGAPDGLWHFDGAHAQRVKQFAGAGASPSNRIEAIGRMADGTLWLGVDRKVHRWNPDAWRAFPNLTAVAYDAERIWATGIDGWWQRDGGAWDAIDAAQLAASGPRLVPGIRWLDTTQLQAAGAILADVSELNGRTIRALTVTASGETWIGTDDGLSRIQGAGVTQDLAGSYVTSLLIEPGAAWVGTIDGLSVFDGAAWTAIAWPGGIQAKTVQTIARGIDGSLWVGTRDGLRRLPPGANALDASAWLLYAKGDELTSAIVNAIWIDANGHVWFGTDGGVNGLDDNGTLDKADDVWVALTTQDGLPADRATAIWRDADGALWMNTDGGLARHMPMTQAPALVIDGIRAEGHLLPITPGLELGWQQTDVNVEFAGASLLADRLAYRYRLDGEDWRRTTERGASVLLQPSGAHTFTVQAIDADLNASPLVTTSFAVQAVPIWAQTWFQVSAALTGAALFGAVMALGPGGRWWRAYKRPAYRETWDIEFGQVRRDVPIVTVQARQRYSRDLRLIAEGRAKRFFSPEGDALVASLEVPDLRSLHEAWQSAAAPSDALARGLGSLLPPEMSRHLREAAARRGYFARLRLNFAQAPALALWPWEVAQSIDLEPLGLNRVTAISRRLPQGEAEALKRMTRVPRHQALSVLLVVASPGDVGLPPLNAQDEFDRLQKALAGTRLSLRVLAGSGAGGPQTKIGLRERLAGEIEKGADVIHFIGHAGPHPRRPEQIVLYGEDKNGFFHAIGASDFIDMIASSQKGARGPRLMVLNACRTATVSGGRALAGLIPDLIMHTGLMAVVGMQYPIDDKAAAVFAATFYAELARTNPVDYAVTLAREAVRREVRSRDWAAPVLYMQAADGMIYEP